MTRQLDELENTTPEKTAALVKTAREYQQLLKKHHLRNWLVNKPENNFWKILLNKLVLIISLPLFVYGFVLNAVPFFAIDTLVRKKIKDFAFWSTFSLVLGLLFFPIVYLLELWALSGFIPGLWFKIAFLVTLPFIGKLAFRWYILFRKTWGRGNLFLLKLFNKEAYQKLIGQKNKLFEQLNTLLPL